MFENIEATKSNFCIGPQSGTFCTVDTEASPVVMYVKNDSGALLRTYTFTPVSILESEPYGYTTSLIDKNQFVTIQYVGPYNQSDYFDGATFYTLERHASLFRTYTGEMGDYFLDTNIYASVTYAPIFDVATIRRWRINAAEFTLELVNTIIKTSSGDDWFDVKAFAIKNTITSFSEQSPAGTGQIEITTTSGLKKYDTIILGPSNDMSNLEKIEEVYVHSINGNTVEIRSYDGGDPTKWEYMAGDSITFLQDIFLFSNPKPAVDPVFDVVYGYTSTSGTLYTLDVANYGNISAVKYGYLFKDVSVAIWNNFYNTLSFVKNSNLLHMDLSDYEIIRSQNIHLIDPGQVDLIELYDIDIEDTTIYKLQREVLQQQEGVYFQVAWSSYNHHEDTLIPYTDSVDLTVSERILFRQGQSFITVTVRDQFGVSLLNKNVIFSSEGDLFGYLTPLDGYMQTDANGQATIQYDASSYYTGHVYINVEVDGGNSSHGDTSLYASTNIIQIMYYESPIFIPTYLESFGSTFLRMSQWLSTDVAIPSHPAYTFPNNRLRDNKMSGWAGRVAGIKPAQLLCVLVPTSSSRAGWPEDAMYPTTYQEHPIVLSTIVAYLDLTCQSSIYIIDSIYNEKQISNNFVSRTLTSGHTASTSLDQYVFVQEARPVMWSEKNNVDTDYWIRLRPFAASLDLSTLVIKLKEVSYLGDPTWVDVTALGTAVLFDAGGGILGIDFIYKPENLFHCSSVVYVDIEVYDSAATPNKIVLTYWFKIIADYRKPYILNKYPLEEMTNAAVNTVITFDALDEGEGVDITSLEVFINARSTAFTYDEYEHGNYHITCNPGRDFYYGEEVNVDVIVYDRSVNRNRLVDGWKFHCSESQGPWFDMNNINPSLCVEGVERTHPVSLQVYGINDTGIKYDSIRLEADGKYRDLIITPIVYRLI